MGFLRLSLPAEYAKRTGLLPNKYQPPTACFSSWSDRDGSVGLEELTQMAVSSIPAALLFLMHSFNATNFNEAIYYNKTS